MALTSSGQLLGWGWNKVDSTFVRLLFSRYILYDSNMKYLRLVNCKLFPLSLQFGQIGVGNNVDCSSPVEVKFPYDQVLEFENEHSSSLFFPYKILSITVTSNFFFYFCKKIVWIGRKQFRCHVGGDTRLLFRSVEMYILGEEAQMDNLGMETPQTGTCMCKKPNAFLENHVIFNQTCDIKKYLISIIHFLGSLGMFQ